MMPLPRSRGADWLSSFDVCVAEQLAMYLVRDWLANLKHPSRSWRRSRFRTATMLCLTSMLGISCASASLVLLTSSCSYTVQCIACSRPIS